MLIVILLSRMILSIWLSTELVYRLSSWSRMASVVYVLFSKSLCISCMVTYRGELCCYVSACTSWACGAYWWLYTGC